MLPFIKQDRVVHLLYSNSTEAGSSIIYIIVPEMAMKSINFVQNIKQHNDGRKIQIWHKVS